MTQALGASLLAFVSLCSVACTPDVSPEDDATSSGGAGGSAAGGAVSQGGASTGGTASGGDSATGGAGEVPGTRNAWDWPFAADSIWNMPIGDDADYQSVSFRTSAHVGVDIQHLVETSLDDPVTEVRKSYVFGAGRCSSTDIHDFSVRVPANWIVPDAGDSPYGGTPNSNFALLQPDGETVFEGVLMARCVAGGPVYLPDFYQYESNRAYQSVRGSGLDGGGQGASGMSALGGTLRKGELTRAQPIRHAIKINPYGAADLYYSGSVPGYKWPAKAADSYAAGSYGGTNPLVVMGSLLAITPDVTAETLGLTTEAGRKLLFTLQNYGVYFVEDAAWDTWDLIVERDAELEFETAYGFSMSSDVWTNEVNILMGALSVIANNSVTTPGGGGTPRQSLAPPFE